MKLSGGREILKLIWSGLLPLKSLSVWTNQSLVTVEKWDTFQICQLLEYEEEHKRLRFSTSATLRTMSLSGRCNFYKIGRNWKDYGARILVKPLILEVCKLRYPLETAKISMEQRNGKIVEYFKCEWVAPSP